jgi:hypothetical protein
LLRQFQCRVQGLARGDNPVAQSHLQRLGRHHLAPGKDEVHRVPHADQARQAHRAAIDQGHTKSAAIDTKIRVLFHHPHIAPQRQLHAAGHCGAADGSHHRLGQQQTGGSHRSLARLCRQNRNRGARPSAQSPGLLGRQSRAGQQVPAGTEMAVRTMEHRHPRVRVCVKGQKRLRESAVRRVGVDRIAHVRAPSVTTVTARAAWFELDLPCNRLDKAVGPTAYRGQPSRRSRTKPL